MSTPRRSVRPSKIRVNDLVTQTSARNGAGPVVRTKQGAVRGRWSFYGAEFRGIPYAEAPRGERRFAPPVRKASWGDDGVLDATYFGDAAPQEAPEPPFGKNLLGTRPSSEDCLNLNVWTPAPDRDAGLPVMVWIHGGGYADESGSDEPFHGHTFARDGVVLVTINYRLGVLGYLHTAETFDAAAGSGNFGTLDQLAALEWVQENIAAFGGDPGRVTVFGESAGGWAVSTLLAAPRARGLFQRGIAQSGAGDHVLTAEQAQRITVRYLDLLGVRPGDMDGLRAADTRAVLSAQAELYGEALAGGEVTEALMGETAKLLLCLMPVTTGEVVGDLPVNLVSSGNGHDVDLLLGSNSEEYGLYRLFPGGVFTAETMLAHAHRDLADRGLDVAAVEAHYRSRFSTDFAVGEGMETDRFFRLPILDLARAHAPGSARTFLYELAWSPTDLGACHVMDVPLVFDRQDTEMARVLVNGDQSKDIAALMHRCWIDFATTGSPDPGGTLGWPETATDRPRSFVIDEESRLDDVRDAALQGLWGRA